MKRLYYASIWAPGAIPAEEWKYRNLKRIMFPVIDALYILGGIVAITKGVFAISLFFPLEIVQLFGAVLSLTAFACLIGVSFPKFWVLEMGGKSILLGLVTGFVVAMLLTAFNHPDTRAFVSVMSLIALCPIVWRISLLGTEWQERIVNGRGRHDDRVE